MIKRYKMLVPGMLILALLVWSIGCEPAADTNQTANNAANVEANDAADTDDAAAEDGDSESDATSKALGGDANKGKTSPTPTPSPGEEPVPGETPEELIPGGCPPGTKGCGDSCIPEGEDCNITKGRG